MKALLLLLLLPLTGCTTALHSKSDLYYRAYLPPQLGGKFSYTGSTSAEHYFYKKRWLQFDRRFTLPVGELQFQCVMPKTSDRSLWRQVTIDGDHLRFYRRDSEVGGYGVFEEIDFVIEHRPNQGAAANRRPAGQSDGSDDLSAIVAADRTFPAAVAELDR